ncbi:TMEM198/TM7SF3 family protein [Chloroflexi bacterium TSY]|nr:TMEM198/TM7SF3 family protein [Chloroflexi bacterium TSY]
MLQTILAGLIAVAIGTVYSVFGYRLFRFLLPIWGFLVGMGFGASLVQSFSRSFLGNATSWIVAIVAGVILGGVAYFFYKVGIVLLGASIGAGLFAYVARSIGMQPGFALYTIALIGAVLVGLLVFRIKVEKLFMVILTSAAGASGIVTGLLIWLGRLSLNDLGTEEVLQPVLSDSWLWVVIWLVVALVGILVQMRVPQLQQPDYA